MAIATAETLAAGSASSSPALHLHHFQRLLVAPGQGSETDALLQRQLNTGNRRSDGHHGVGCITGRGHPGQVDDDMRVLPRRVDPLQAETQSGDVAL
ncbi:MAG: hypothetical protein WA989_01540 [Henriciella sp.]|uniref:hypothetical protein n=1 Tax=Henriciella sp. TaxID=1968823 RepID=UPI003C771E54